MHLALCLQPPNKTLVPQLHAGTDALLRQKKRVVPTGSACVFQHWVMGVLFVTSQRDNFQKPKIYSLESGASKESKKKLTFLLCSLTSKWPILRPENFGRCILHHIRCWTQDLTVPRNAMCKSVTVRMRCVLPPEWEQGNIFFPPLRSMQTCSGRPAQPGATPPTRCERHGLKAAELIWFESNAGLNHCLLAQI